MKSKQPPAPSSDTTRQTKKRIKKKSHSKPLPLVKGATASSLARKRDAESSTSSRSKRRKRARDTTDSAGAKSNKESSQLFSSTAESLAVISKFHTLNKRLEQNERDESISEKERQRNAKQIKKEQEAMGGLDRYQKASMYGAKSSKFVCADWVVPLLLERKQKATARPTGDDTNKGGGRRIRILDVGAIDNQYHGKGYDDWLDAVAIDLHGGQHESVLQVNFFDYAHEYCCGTDLALAASNNPKTATTTANSKANANNSKKPSSSQPSPQSSSPRPFDAIVMSLVLNFQGDPRKRGDMLALAADPRLLKAEQGGMLFVVLPSASLDNSRYCDLDRFVEVVTNPHLFSFELVEKKISAKLILLAFQRKAPLLSPEKKNNNNNSDPQKDPSKRIGCYDAATKTFDYGEHEMKRLQPAKPGAKRNNFAVILKSSANRT
jgi:25S rRNA (adenine2142-N1)-methyltransferase